jgi:protein AATF/BFR2
MGIDDPALLSLKYASMKSQRSKKKKQVDTRASKGRKIRYQVHEKIQNFMAPEPRGTWHDEMVEELFSSLLGSEDTVVAQSSDEVALVDDGFKIMV